MTNRKYIFYLALILGGGLLHCAAQMDHRTVNQSAAPLLRDFKNCQVFWKQFKIAEKIVALHDTNVLQSPILTDGLTNEDRHARGNAAFIFAALGDERGFETLRTILTDRSPRPTEIDDDALRPSLRLQIKEDRYYAVHLFGDLKEPRAVPILIPLLKDQDVNYIVPWSLGEIGDKRAISPLIGTLDDQSPSMRVLAIYALTQLHATQALPRLQELLNDNDRSNFADMVSVAEAARGAITQLEAKP
jgi:HEAT repeat protein